MESAIKILALRALALHAEDTPDGALSLLEQALSLAEPEGYVRTFIDEGKPMARLPRQALSQDIRDAFTGHRHLAFGPSSKSQYNVSLSIGVCLSIEGRLHDH